MAIFGLQRNSSSSLAPPLPQPWRTKSTRHPLHCPTSTTTTSHHLSPCSTTNCCRCLSLASTSLSPPPPPTCRCILLSSPILCDRCRAAFVLAAASNTSPNFIASSASLPVRLLILAHRCLIPCSALPLKTCRTLLNMKECRSDFTPVRKLAIFSW